MEGAGKGRRGCRGVSGGGGEGQGCVQGGEWRGSQQVVR